MNKTSSLAHKVVDVARSSYDSVVLQPPAVGLNSWQNELLLFIKPEMFMVEEPQKPIDLVLSKLDEYKVQISGVAIIGGRVLEQTEIMNRHYGYINLLSRSASTVLTTQDIRAIEDVFGLAPASYRILGGHEYLKEHPDQTNADLDSMWFSEKSTKIKSGFYVRSVRQGNDQLVLVNAFHPAQLAHFTESAHRIALFLVHSDTPWSELRNDMVGTTFPEKANPTSIRGSLHAQAQEYGFREVTVANNGVHLSAGPFEAMFEITNFFGNLTGMSIVEQPPLVLRRMLEAEIDEIKAKAALDNPPINYNGSTTNLFSATEDMNTDDAIALYKQALGYSG
jgi:nucleoside diphosphate kinase